MVKGSWGPPLTRFWYYVKKTDDCWLWTGAKTYWGYGLFWNGQKLIPAHRYSYELAKGPIPEGLELDHLCHNRSDCKGGITCPHRACVNPEHLEAVTTRVNTKRGRSMRTHCPHGHPYEGVNLYFGPGGARRCVACRQESVKRWSEKKLKSPLPD